MRRALLVLTLALALLEAPAAFGQNIAIGVFGGSAPTSTVFASAHVRGAVTVDFHGDAAAGCAAAGTCGLSGTVTWQPSDSADLIAFGLRRHGHAYEQGFLAFGSGGEGEPRPGSTSAQVRRAGAGPGGICADGAGSEFTSVEFPERRGSSLAVRITPAPGAGPAEGDSFRTRCAGPTARDLAALLPRRLVTERDLLDGRTVLDFSADGKFSAHGFSGTLHSDVVILVRKGESPDDDGDVGQEGPVVRHRLLTVNYRVERVSGSVVTAFRGLSDPDLCAPLDACGVAGTLTLAQSARSGEAALLASARVRGHSWADLRRALGLLPGPREPGIGVGGFAEWERGRGSVTAELTRDGAPDCRDSEPLAGGGFVSLRVRGGTVVASYRTPASGNGDPMPTRCQGPSGEDIASSRPLATGTLPLSAFRRRHVTIHLDQGIGFRGDGYRGRTRPDLTVVLRRGRVRKQIDVQR